jgi:hypothetical protein
MFFGVATDKQDSQLWTRIFSTRPLPVRDPLDGNARARALIQLSSGDPTLSTTMVWCALNRYHSASTLFDVSEGVSWLLTNCVAGNRHPSKTSGLPPMDPDIRLRFQHLDGRRLSFGIRAPRRFSRVRCPWAFNARQFAKE